VQANRTRKDELTDLIQSFTKTIDYILTDDVAITIEWLSNDRERYESDVAPDVDNIIKPILDALDGPDGIMIDDCQIQAVTCSWLGGWSPGLQRIDIRLVFQPDIGFGPSWIYKKDLVIVQFDRGLCMPFDLAQQAEKVLESLEFCERAIVIRDAYLAKTGDWGRAQGHLPMQRIFHRSRVSEFEIITIDDLRQKLKME
jgi:hypothetical protein